MQILFFLMITKQRMSKYSMTSFKYPGVNVCLLGKPTQSHAHCTCTKGESALKI